MKLFIACFLMLSLLGCTTPAVQTPDPVETPVVETPIVEPPQTTEPATSTEPVATIALADYFPDLTDVIRHYHGDGNEYASYSERTEYTKDNLFQFHSNNGGTQTVKVFEITPTQVKQVYTESEIYYRENHLNRRTPEKERILLQTPLEVGTGWDNPDGSSMKIIGVDEALTLFNGETVSAIVVQSNDNMKYYYAPGFGLVKTDFQDGSVLSSLDEFTRNQAYQENVVLYVPNDDVTALVPVEETVEFKTNAVVRDTFSELLKRDHPKGLGLPQDFKILSMYKNQQDGFAYVDVSQAIKQWNVGASAEALGIQGLVKTIGLFLQAEKVYFWVEGEGYSSGHVEFDKNTPFLTNPTTP